jgi:ketosteroid isomerase-like protein
MSEHNVEVLRGLFEAFNARDIDAFIASCDPSIKFHSTFAAVGGAVYHGHDGLRGWQQDLEEAWGDEIRIEVEAYFDLGERTLAFNVLHGRGLHSGAEVTMEVAAVVTWRENLIVHFMTYGHREDALRDLDISEDELEPIEP